MKIEDFEVGDLIVVDSGNRGFDIYDREGNRVCFFTKMGEAGLLEWLKVKSQKDPSWVQQNIARTKRKRWS
jgi:hypothetical protein